MLRKIRVAAAVIFFALITLLFLDYSGLLHKWLGWLAKIQLVPAILAVNVAVLVALLLFTLLFGRVYCSVICPLGVMQDCVTWVRKRFKKKRYSYKKPLTWLRYSLLAIFIIAGVAHLTLLFTLLEPYSAYGRIATELLAPVYRLANNGLELIAERIDSYAIHSADVWVKSTLTLVVASLTLLIVGLLAWRNGRTYCNTVCPVGTVLGFVSKFSLFKPVFKEGACNGCSRCERVCKASCIDHKTQTVDYSRCVACMNCIDKCKQGALKYRFAWCKKEEVPQPVEKLNADEKSGMSRRGFLSLTATFAAANALRAQDSGVDGGLAVIEDKKIPDRQTPIVPPGAGNAAHFRVHCTACQLCVSSCPNSILRPSTSLKTFMQPEMSYERGYCRPECTRCSEVCPTGAIKKISAEDKSATQIGRAYWIKENCVVNRDDVVCINCERHCPTGAIMLVPRDPEDPKSLGIPAIDNERCIGCGACENLCPARPFSAIYVEGNTRHRTV